jgi:ribosomal protein S8
MKILKENILFLFIDENYDEKITFVISNGNNNEMKNKSSVIPLTLLKCQIFDIIINRDFINDFKMN